MNDDELAEMDRHERQVNAEFRRLRAAADKAVAQARAETDAATRRAEKAELENGWLRVELAEVKTALQEADDALVDAQRAVARVAPSMEGSLTLAEQIHRLAKGTR